MNSPASNLAIVIVLVALVNCAGKPWLTAAAMVAVVLVGLAVALHHARRRVVQP